MCSDGMRGQVISLSLAMLAAISVAGQGPLEKGQEVAWTHAPFEAGACGICHESDDPQSPGRITQPVNDLCYMCHEELKDMMSEWHSVHAAADEKCTNCHNAHNASWKKLLVQQVPGLCMTCHEDIEAKATQSQVTHGAVTSGTACLNCHNPHATHVDNLLIQVTYDLCVNCHSTNGMLDDQGRELTNFDALLASTTVPHGPVAAKDCSACHDPHGSDNFRLLVQEYPAKFYSPYDPKNYSLCFTCHNEQMVADPQTTTLTNFRDGSRNLHYLHVNKADRGRTCRACHEVHSAQQAHIIRDGVPYGSSGWILPINYEPLPDGGLCQKTCHSTRRYDRTRQ